MTAKISNNEELLHARAPSSEQDKKRSSIFKEIYNELSSQSDEKEHPLENPLALAPPPPVPFSAPLLSTEQIKAGALEVEVFFHQMVEKITTVQAQGLTTTTVILPENDTSILSGTEVTITEYNTAPKDYNISIKGSPEATVLFQAHLGELVTALNTEYRTFKINRLDLVLHSKKAHGIAKHKSEKSKELEDDGSALPLD